MVAHSLRRIAQVYLAKSPTIYRRLLIATGRGSPEKLRYLQLIRQGDVVFDVGANVGYFTLLFSDLAGANGAVHAFEPVPLTRDRLERRIQNLALYPNIVVNADACSDRAGVSEITVPGDDFGQASLLRHGNASWAGASSFQSFSVETIKLDDYAAARKLANVNFIKCDAEGAELFVLKGAEKMLMEALPIVSLEVAEYWTKDFGYGPKDIAEFLIDCGYSDFMIEDELIAKESFSSCLAEKAHAESLQVLCAQGRNAERLRALAACTNQRVLPSGSTS